MNRPAPARPMPVFRPRRNTLLFGIFVFLAVSANFYWLSSREDHAYWSDETWFVEAAENLRAGNLGEDPTRRAPGPALFLAGWMSLGKSWTTLRLSNLALGLLAAAIMFRISLHLHQDPKTARLCFLACLIHPFFVYLRGFLLSENLMIVFLLLSTLFLIQAAKKPTLPRWFLAGIVVGLANGVRPVFLLVPILLPLILHFVCRFPRRDLILRTTTFLLGCLLVLGVWIGQNYRITGSIHLTSMSNYEIYKGVATPPGEPISTYGSGSGKGKSLSDTIRYVFDNPGKALWHKMHYAGRFFWPGKDHVEQQSDDPLLSVLSFGVLLTLYVLAALGFSSADRRVRGILIGLIVCYWLLHVLVVVKFRYRIPLDALFILLAAGGIPVAWLKVTNILKNPRSQPARNGQNS